MDNARGASVPSTFGLLEQRLGDWFQVVTTVEQPELSRGGPVLQLDVAPDPHQLVLVEDPGTGVLAWAWPESRPSRGAGSASAATFTFAGATERGLVSTIGKKVVRLLKPAIVDRVLAEAGERFAAAWEHTHRPERLVWFDARSAASGDTAVIADREAFGDEPAVLLLHGIAARTASGFAGLRGRGLSRLTTHYGSRIVGYDHPSLSRSPADNAADLLRQLQALHAIRPLPPLDLVGYGRGGLVARALAGELARSGDAITVGRIWCVGTPNLGQRLADRDSLRSYVDRITNIIGWLPVGGVGDVVDGVLTTVSHLALGALGGLPGITDMAPQSPFLTSLNAGAERDAARVFAIASNYVPRSGAPLAERAKALAASRLMPIPNDLLTPVESVFGPSASPLVLPANQRLFSDAHGVSHADYFTHPATVEYLLGTTSGTRGLDVTPDTWQASVDDEDGPILSISVSHCSLEEARFAVMVGTYDNESLAGAERFLDRQLHGELLARLEVDQYPAALGTSLFLSTEHDQDNASGLSGAYVVGLGSTLSLGRPELTRAVRQALVDRCLTLYRQQGDDASQPTDPAGVIEVGVSTTLLGVRNSDGLAVTESVAGVVEGVLEANRALLRYEKERRRPARPVRITALEFVERYADRADRAAMAVRTLLSLVRLGPGYDYLQQITVDSSKRGGLPAGSAVNDSPQEWHRFVITGSTPPPVVGAATSASTMRLEITALGADARADRVAHELDERVVDALVERLGHDHGDRAAAATLFNVLVPEELRLQFQTTSAVQFVVDASTANLPWELLPAPRGGHLRRLAESTSVVRQFTEHDDRRIAPLRARSGAALVLAAGNLSIAQKLPGVYEEADAVATALRNNARLTVSVLHDRDAPFDPAELMIDLFGEHQLLHIASHGEYVEGDPARTGALLSDDIVLTAAKVRSLPTVPELVFLNCCNLGRIGLNRMAAGLARELMAIGVRAVIAAGWKVGDAAAVAFAETFYDRFLAGVPFGAAVASARLACSSAGGGETWAAYQCYGDPTLVFSGVAPTLQESENEPASADDLLRRLSSLDVRASDLGRPGEVGLQRRRTVLLRELGSLSAWADEHGLGRSAAVQRRIAKVARELGEFGLAAERYLRMISEKEEGGRVVVRLRNGEASAVDLQQAANCLARSAPQEMERAVRIAKAACTIVGDRESFGIMGGIHRRWAQADPARRREHLLDSFRSYRRAVEVAATASDGKDDPLRIGVYGRENARQIAALIDTADPYGQVPPEGADAAPRSRWVDERSTVRRSFWDCAGLGDTLLSDLLHERTVDRAAHLADRMISAYERAFGARSTFSERNSVLDHLRGLRDLVSSDPTFGPVIVELDRACERLQHWEALFVGTPATDAPADEAVPAEADTAEARAARPVAAAGSVVTLSALHAGKGDCLVVEYTGHDRLTHRMVIDGGLGSAFDKGFGAYAKRHADTGAVAADVVVVTHIDADHIGGVIKMFEQGAVVAEDVWFNGLEQIATTRGVAQADDFSTLIPHERRNRVLGHRAMVVPDDGPLPVLGLPGGAKCTLLSPVSKGLERLHKLWQDKAERGVADPARLAGLFDEAEAAEASRGSSFGDDPSVPNESSIAFLFEHHGRTLLLSGDAHADVLQRSIERLLEQRRQQQLHLDVFKLSHHSSRNNLSAALLELVTVDRFLVCTSGNSSHPDPDGLELVRTKFPTTPIVFTDDSAAIRAAAKKAGLTAATTVCPADGGITQIALTPLPSR